MQTLDAALLCTTVISYPACFGYSNPEGMLVVSNSLSGELGLCTFRCHPHYLVVIALTFNIYNLSGPVYPSIT